MTAESEAGYTVPVDVGAGLQAAVLLIAGACVVVLVLLTAWALWIGADEIAWRVRGWWRAERQAARDRRRAAARAAARRDVADAAREMR